ncbi:hypothetical protein [Pseudomonas sp. NPDC085632]|uniref:hypothetical protein n=1 Tax=Pseudomonas sp. NPDC085632 TaxID=3364429 RepID=UPI0037C9F826
MSLRVRAPAPPSELESGALPEPPDGWATRLAKLMPAEALGLYGAAAALVPGVSAELTVGSRIKVLWGVAIVCLLFSAAIRWQATTQNGKPQIIAIAISSISFLIWLMALGPPNSPIQLSSGFAFVGPLIAVLWATIVSYFYRGD